MASVRIKEVVFVGLLSIKGRSRTSSQITAADARKGDLVMHEIDGRVLRVESPLGVQRIPLSQVKTMLEAEELPAKGAK